MAKRVNWLALIKVNIAASVFIGGIWPTKIQKIKNLRSADEQPKKNAKNRIEQEDENLELCIFLSVSNKRVFNKSQLKVKITFLFSCPTFHQYYRQDPQAHQQS